MGVKVKVLSGDGTRDMGFGEYVGDVPISVVCSARGNILMTIAGHDPVDGVDLEGGDVFQLDAIPKIILENGEIRYGCEVFWVPVEQLDQGAGFWEQMSVHDADSDREYEEMMQRLDGGAS